MIIDDLSSGFSSRDEARTSIDAQMIRPLTWKPGDVDTIDEDSWGTSDEAIAAQGSSFWDGL